MTNYTAITDLSERIILLGGANSQPDIPLSEFIKLRHRLNWLVNETFRDATYVFSLDVAEDCVYIHSEDNDVCLSSDPGNEFIVVCNISGRPRVKVPPMPCTSKEMLDILTILAEGELIRALADSELNLKSRITIPVRAHRMAPGIIKVLSALQAKWYSLAFSPINHPYNF